MQALVVLSGGQDSTTCLYWALRHFAAVQALTFDYGQRQRRELTCAAHIAQAAGVAHTVLPINTFHALGGNALTDPTLPLPNQANASAHTASPNTTLPNTFVPGRNLIFLTFAAAFAYQHGMQHLVTGVAEVDYSGYPDCRQHTLQALQQALRLGMDYPITIHAPLMRLSKADTVRLALQVGAMAALAHTHTCYANQHPPCGSCAACVLRAQGFAAAGVVDPLLTTP